MRPQLFGKHPNLNQITSINTLASPDKNYFILNFQWQLGNSAAVLPCQLQLPAVSPSKLIKIAVNFRIELPEQKSQLDILGGKSKRILDRVNQ